MHHLDASRTKMCWVEVEIGIEEEYEVEVESILANRLGTAYINGFISVCIAKRKEQWSDIDV